MTDFGNSDILDAKAGNIFDGGPSFSLKNRIIRAIFGATWMALARWTPPPMFKWRIFILRLFGAKIHKTARIYASSRIWLPSNLTVGQSAVIGPRTIIYNMAEIKLGARAIVSQGTHLCAGTHIYRERNFQLIAKPIFIDEGAWIATEAFIGPGVTVGKDAVLGARAVAMRSLNANTVYAGNPAQPLGVRYTD